MSGLNEAGQVHLIMVHNCCNGVRSQCIHSMYIPLDRPSCEYGSGGNGSYASGYLYDVNKSLRHLVVVGQIYEYVLHVYHTQKEKCTNEGTKKEKCTVNWHCHMITTLQRKLCYACHSQMQ